MEDAELKKAGLKVTLPRLKILQILESQPEASQHMSAEDVYRALLGAGEDVGLAGRVIEFHDAEIESRQRAIVDSHGYKLIGHSLVLYVKEKRSE